MNLHHSLNLQQAKKELGALISLTKLHLLKEYPPQSLLSVSEPLPPLSDEKETISSQLNPPIDELDPPLQNKPPLQANPSSPVPSTPPEKAKREMIEPAQKQHEPLPLKENQLSANRAKKEESLATKQSLENLKKALTEKMAPVPPPAPPFAELKNTFAKLFPQVEWIEPMSDQVSSQAVQKRQKKETALLIIGANEEGEEKALLERMCRALNKEIGIAAKVEASEMEEKNLWPKIAESPSLKLIIFTSSEKLKLPSIQTLLNLKAHKKEEQMHFGSIPLLCLQSAKELLKNPQKRTLIWQQIATLMQRTEETD